ncbi:peptide deformylase [Saccharobesus litoralis]|uniref:Peptide deformylase n=1 Tax=Saccharobesus litoralis TaxID=2172099 RepID=A0A2S0VQF8_9ALTE|nr:peptide deformylase [Saccharobesus litoralis]AWB66453.1 peptide deformylase [Saccharobesus litoralis]
MAVLEVLKYPDERLRTVAKAVEQVTPEIQTKVADMIETMYQASGVGLASTQVDIIERIFVADCSDEQNEPLVFINPQITDKRGIRQHEEGCLSFPGVYAKVERADEVTVKALDKDGNEFSMDADGLMAICIQHELDHLDGKLFVDYLSPLKRQRIKAKLEKEAKLAARRAK